MNDDDAHLVRDFRFFADMCAGDAPLYAVLSRHVADDHAVRSLAAAHQPRQPPCNLLFGAVHDLLLRGREHPLAAYYRSVGGELPPDGAWPEFRDFCDAFADEITSMVATRRVQTNAVGRCGVLLPALARASGHFGGRPLFAIEVGASAGLNLLFDHYRYEYGNGHLVGPSSAARIRTEIRGDVPCPLPDSIPTVDGRVGIDIAPVDVTDADAVRWVQAMIWPDLVDRFVLFRAAAAIAAADPPRIIRGDGLEVLPGVIDSVPPHALPCVFHSHAIYQMNEAWRERFEIAIAARGRARDLAHISLEWLGDDPGPRLHLSTFESGVATRVHLADGHHHGRWIRWRAG